MLAEVMSEVCLADETKAVLLLTHSLSLADFCGCGFGI